MKIGLHDAEREYLKNKHFPNYALMKISAWHKAQGFERAEKIMKEIHEIDDFIKVYKEACSVSVTAVERGATSLDCSKERKLFVKKDSYLYKDILNSLNKRGDELIEEFGKI